MRTALSLIFAVAASVASGTAQNDKIYWTDGTVTDRVTVVGFNLREVAFKSRGVEERKSSDRVKELEISKVNDKYRQAQGGNRGERLATLLQLAERYQKDPFVSQFGYRDAARMLLEAGEFGDAFACLEEMVEKCPDSGFVPMLYREKIDYYIGNEKKKDAATVAKKYAAAAQSQGYPKGYVIESSYFTSLTAGLNGELESAQLRKAMNDVVRNADPNFPDIAGKAKLQIANLLRGEGKVEEAKSDFVDLIEDKKSTSDIRAAAWLGLGHVNQAAGNPADKEPYKQAMLAFLRVYLSDDAPGSLKAEALHFGSQAAKKWGGERSSFYSRVMKARLYNSYPDSPWVK